MKIWKNKFLKQMIIIITVIYLILNCIAPTTVYANKSQESNGVNWKTVLQGIAGVAGFVAGGFLTGGISWGVAVVGGVTCIAAGMAYDAAVEGEGIEDIPRKFVIRVVYINDKCRRCCTRNATKLDAWY